MASEDFTGAAAALSGSWSQQRTIATGTVNKNGSGAGVASVNLVNVFAFWNADPFSPDHSSEITIAGGLSSTMWAYATVRASGTTDATFNNYTFFTNGLSGTGNTGIIRWVAGVQTEILPIAATFTTGDVMRIQAVGSRISAYKNGVLVGVVTDTNLPTGAPGCGLFGNTVSIDNWSGGNLAGAGITPTRRIFGGRSRIRSINTPSGPFDQRGFLRQRIWDYTLLAVAAGTIYNVDVAETLSASDSQTAQVDFASAIAESGSATDSQTGNAVFVTDIGESVTVSENETGALVFTVARGEALTASDSETGLAAFASSISETGSAADSQTGIAQFSVARAETLTASDVETVSGLFVSATSESLTASDAETSTAIFVVAETESLTAADSQDGNTGAATFNVTAADTLTASDSESASAVFANARAEALTASDSETGTALFSAARAETLATTETDAATAIMGVAQSEALSASDSSDGNSASTTITRAVAQSVGTDSVVSGNAGSAGLIAQNTATVPITQNSSTSSIISTNSAITPIISGD